MILVRCSISLKCTHASRPSGCEKDCSRPNPSPNKGIAFVRDLAGTSNIWVLPLAGGPPTQLTKFRKGTIDSFGFAPDGKLVLARGDVQSNSVLISNFH